MPDSPAGYGYHWWMVPPLPGGVNNGAFSANRVFGQFIFVNPTEQVVIAIQSAWRQPHDSDAELEVVAMIRAAVSALTAMTAPADPINTCRRSMPIPVSPDPKSLAVN